MLFKSIVLSFILLSLSVFPVFAVPDVKLELESKKLIKQNNKETLIEAGTVHPGDILVYTIKAINKGDSAAVGFEPVGNIPPNTIYVPEKNTSGNYKIFFSIDGGKSYQEKPVIKVKEKGKDITKPAPFEMYNKIKWSFLKELNPQSTVNLTYKVKVK